jgi:hypothetical protein
LKDSAATAENILRKFRIGWKNRRLQEEYPLTTLISPVFITTLLKKLIISANPPFVRLV